MLTTATPIFENVPATFADPVGLADQQAQGVVALIVVRYAQTEDTLAVLGGVYDAFVCVSGQLLTVARSTPDYRFPVMPAVALRRFIEHRDAGKKAFLSVYELSELECAKFVETVFFSECMKLMIGTVPMVGESSGDGYAGDGYGGDEHAGDGYAGASAALAHPDARLVADQLVRSGCGNGVLELNDFTNPDSPRIRLVDLAELASSVGVVADHSHPIIPGGTIDPAGLAAVLAGHMAGFVGRVLLYDRAKNKAALPDKTGTPFDLMAAIREANRLAQARRGGDATAALAQAETELRASAPPSTEQADQVETYLKERAERPRAVEPSHPVASGLGALIAELQGGPSVDAPPLLSLDLPEPAPTPEPATKPTANADATATNADAGTDDFEPVVWADVDLDIPADTLLRAAHGDDYVSPTEPAPAAEVDASDQLRATADVSTGLPDQQPDTRFTPPPCHREERSSLPSARSGDVAISSHPLAYELETLRSGIYDLLADAATPERAEEAHAHVLSTLGITGPDVPGEQVIAYIRTLLVEPPPKRWMMYKRQRGKIAPDASGKLMAFHRAHSHLDDPCIDDAGMLWARLHK